MARFGSNAVVLVVSGVPLILCAAHATRFDTCADLRAQEADVAFSLSRHDLSRGRTDDAAIDAERDALDERRHCGLGKRIVGARGARLRTLDFAHRVQAVDTAQQLRPPTIRSLKRNAISCTRAHSETSSLLDKEKTNGHPNYAFNDHTGDDQECLQGDHG